MSRLKTAAIALSFLLSVGAPATAQELVKIPVGQDFNTFEFNWNGGLGKMDVAWDIIARDKKTWLCGAKSDSNGSVRGPNRQALRKGWIKINGKKYLTDLSFFTRVKTGKALSGEMATCKPIGPVYPRDTKFLLGFDPVRVRI